MLNITARTPAMPRDVGSARLAHAGDHAGARHRWNRGSVGMAGPLLFDPLPYPNAGRVGEFVASSLDRGRVPAGRFPRFSRRGGAGPAMSPCRSGDAPS